MGVMQYRPKVYKASILSLSLLVNALKLIFLVHFEARCYIISIVRANILQGTSYRECTASQLAGWMADGLSD